MNRRRFLAALPIAPLTALASAHGHADAAPESIDTRMTFHLSDYALARAGTPWECQYHTGDNHGGLYTHGCHPVAFLRNSGPDDDSIPATRDAVPVDLIGSACALSHPGLLKAAPHQHNDFRWVD